MAMIRQAFQMSSERSGIAEGWGCCVVTTVLDTKKQCQAVGPPGRKLIQVMAGAYHPPPCRPYRIPPPHPQQ